MSGGLQKAGTYVVTPAITQTGHRHAAGARRAAADNHISFYISVPESVLFLGVMIVFQNGGNIKGKTAGGSAGGHGIGLPNLGPIAKVGISPGRKNLDRVVAVAGPHQRKPRGS